MADPGYGYVEFCYLWALWHSKFGEAEHLPDTNPVCVNSFLQNFSHDEVKRTVKSMVPKIESKKNRHLAEMDLKFN